MIGIVGLVPVSKRPSKGGFVERLKRGKELEEGKEAAAENVGSA